MQSSDSSLSAGADSLSSKKSLTPKDEQGFLKPPTTVGLSTQPSSTNKNQEINRTQRSFRIQNITNISVCKLDDKSEPVSPLKLKKRMVAPSGSKR
jgi:hypothetical protein